MYWEFAKLIKKLLKNCMLKFKKLITIYSLKLLNQTPKNSKQYAFR